MDYVDVDGFSLHLMANPPLPTVEMLARASCIICVQLPPNLRHASQVVNLDLLQIIVSGTGHITNSPFWRSLPEGAYLNFANATGLQVSSIGEHALAGALMLNHKLDTLVIAAANEKRWFDNSRLGGHYVRELRGMTVGILGYGAIGRETARMFASMGCAIHAATRSGSIRPLESFRVLGTGDPEGQLPRQVFATTKPDSLRAFFASCDVVVNSLPSAPENRRIVGEAALRAMKDDAILINVGRGDTVHTDVLVEALMAEPSAKGSMAEGGNLCIGGASLDVTDPEPLPANHPMFSLPNCIITPHSAGLSTSYLERAVELISENVTRVRDGRAIINQVHV